VCVFSPGSDECVARNFGHGSVVCECNSTHCDSIGSDTLPALGQFLSFTSSKAGSRLQRGQGQVQKNSTGAGENSLGWKQQPPLAQGWETKKTKACTHCYPSGPVLTTPLSPSISPSSQADCGSLPEVPEDQRVWRSHDRLSCHQHPVSVPQNTGPATTTVLLCSGWEVRVSLRAIAIIIITRIVMPILFE
jgi:hypothetical protein